MDNFKIKVSSPEESARVQRELFRRGCKWSGCFETILHTKKHFLFVDGRYITFGDDLFYFIGHPYREITIGDLFIRGDMCQIDKMREEIEGINNVLKAVNKNVEALTEGLKNKEQIIENQKYIINLLKKENEAYDTRIAELEAIVKEAGLEV